MQERVLLRGGAEEAKRRAAQRYQHLYPLPGAALCAYGEPTAARAAPACD